MTNWLHRRSRFLCSGVWWHPDSPSRAGRWWGRRGDAQGAVPMRREEEGWHKAEGFPLWKDRPRKSHPCAHHGCGVKHAEVRHEVMHLSPLFLCWYRLFISDLNGANCLGFGLPPVAWLCFSEFVMPCCDGFYNSSLHRWLENTRPHLIMQPVGLHVDMFWLMLTMLPGKRLANPSFHLLSILMGAFLRFICRGVCVWEGNK